MADGGNDSLHSRAFALVGHRCSGKTSLGDMLLHAAGVTRRMGRVDEKTSLLEGSGGAPLLRGTCGINHAWLNHGDERLYLFDTPGCVGLAGDIVSLAPAMDATVLVVAANDGVGTVAGPARALVRETPSIAVIQKIELAHDIQSIQTEIEALSGKQALQLQIPFVDEDHQVRGLIDLLRGCVLRYGEEGAFSSEPIPDRLRATANDARERLVERVAMLNDERLERYLEYFELSAEDVAEGLREGVENGKIIPVLLCSSALEMGAVPLLDALVSILPRRSAPAWAEVEPGGFSATVVRRTIEPDGRVQTLLRVWDGDVAGSKTWITGETHATSKPRKLFHLRGTRRNLASHTSAGAVVATYEPVHASVGHTLASGHGICAPPSLAMPTMVRRLLDVAVSMRSRVEQVIKDVISCDSSVSLSFDDVTGAPVLGAPAIEPILRIQQHLVDVFGIAADLSLPTVNYREAPTLTVTGAHGRHVKTIAGLVEEFGECDISLMPAPHVEAVEFENQVAESMVPGRLISGVATGVKTACEYGPRAGLPVVGLRVTCTQGEYDVLCSEESHFARAAAEAVHVALERAETRIVEPWLKLQIHVEDAHVGHVIHEISLREGRITGVSSAGDGVVSALCPERSLQGFAAKLRGITHGLGWFETGYSHYDWVPDSALSSVTRSLASRARSGTMRLAHGRTA